VWRTPAFFLQGGLGFHVGLTILPGVSVFLLACTPEGDGHNIIEIFFSNMSFVSPVPRLLVFEEALDYSRLQQSINRGTEQ
jgi:hypothetical protein